MNHGRHSYAATPCVYVLRYTGRDGNAAECELGGYVYFSRLEAAERENAFMTSLDKWRRAFYRYDFANEGHAQEWLDTATEKYGRYLELDWNGGDPRVTARRELVSRVLNKYGCHVILQSGSDYTAQELLDNNHARDPVEKLWRTMKSELDFRAARTKSDATTQGQIFIAWGASILYRLLLNAARSAGVDGSVNEILAPLRKIQLECIGGRQIPKRMTASAVKVVVAMGLEALFPEFILDLEKPVAERERLARKKADDRRGRKARFPLKKNLQE